MSATGSSLQDNTVLITGADGFIGSHLVERVLDSGAKLRAFCLYNSFGSAGWLDESERFKQAMDDGQAELVLGDIRDAEVVDNAVAGTDIVLHLAALVAIPYSYLAARSYVDTNVSGTLNVLESVRRHQIARLVHTSTSEVYGTPDTIPITESHPLRGQSPYSATKIAADKLCEAFAMSFGTPVITLRPFNTFGPRQSSRAVIPTVLSQMLAGAKQVRLGSTTPKRDFTFVTDTCDGFVRAATADLPAGETVQLGTGACYSIAEVVHSCQRITGSDADILTDDARLRPDNSEVEVLLSDPTKARAQLGWAPTIDLEQGLMATAKWLEPRVDADTAARYQR